jgi:hypothetical protein
MSGLVVTVLAGGRPDLLETTLLYARKFLEERPRDRFAIVHSDDEVSAQILDRYGFDVELRGASANGPNTSALWKAAADSKADYLLHLEDDWAMRDDPHDMLDAMRALESRPDVGQVRLRVAHDRVCQYNWVTGQDVRAEADPEFYGLSVGNWHATLNPTLMRCRDLPALLPFRDEAELMRKFQAQGWKVAQLWPGCFAHIGAGRSLEGH